MSDNEGEGAQAREQDRFLPIANIARIMKKTLPANAKIAKDAKEVRARREGGGLDKPNPLAEALLAALRPQTVQECVSEFISFITSE